MPKYKNGKVVISYDLIRRKGRDLKIKKILQGGTLRNLLFHRIFLEFVDKKIFFKV
jgi:hypothetical protein